MSRLLIRIANNGALLFGWSAVSYFIRFSRNVILAHLLTKSNYGVSVALTAIASSVQLLTDLGLEKLLIQEQKMSTGALQPVLTTLMVLRAGFAALLLLVTAGPIADMLGEHAAGNAFRILAIGIALQGFCHLDTKRYQRLHRFGPDLAVGVSGDCVDFLVAVIGGYLTRSYVALPVAFLAGMFCRIIVSNVLAERRLSFGWDVQIVRHAMRFGLPLVLSGLIMLLASQADRLVIGGYLGVVSLATYGVAMTVLSTPGMFASSASLSLALPLLTEVSLNVREFRKRFRQMGIVLATAAVGMFVPLILVGRSLILLIFGSRYLPPPDLVWIIGVGQAMALLRMWPNAGALAIGDTRNLVISNMPRMLGIGLAIVGIVMKLRMEAIVSSFSFAEVAATSASLFYLTRRHRELGNFTGLIISLVFYLGVAAILSHIALPLAVSCVASVALVAGFCGTVLTTSGDARSLVRKVSDQLRFAG